MLSLTVTSVLFELVVAMATEKEYASLEVERAAELLIQSKEFSNGLRILDAEYPGLMKSLYRKLSDARNGE